MTSLATQTCLDQQVVIYVPILIEPQREECALLHLGRLFGGATSTKAEGSWVSSSTGRLIQEPIAKVTSFTTVEQLEAHLGEVLEFCTEMKVTLNQEAISLEINGKMYLV